jgi:hypothetical protein
VTVTSSSGFILRRIFYSVPSQLIGHRLRGRLFDDRLELFLNGARHLTLTRGRVAPGSNNGHVVDYRHVIHSLKRKPMALLNLVYRDQLFPRPAYAKTFDLLVAEQTPRAACKIMVDLLALAHERACEAELADSLTADLNAGRQPNIEALTMLFKRDNRSIPDIVVMLPSLNVYDELGTVLTGETA